MEKGVVLVIRDGWGYRKSKEKNAIATANTPFTNYLMKNYPNSLLKASGKAAGLLEGYQGNSEVGHMTIGSGRIIKQSLTRINESIENKSFFRNKALLSAIKNCKKNKSTLHIAGLLQSEGVHAHEGHLFALLELCKKEDFSKVYLHLFTDGRDAPVKDSLKHLKKIEEKIKNLGLGEIVTISGRFYSMDRDKRWERTKKTYEAIVKGKSKITFSKPRKTIEESHKKKVTDEFVVPRIKESYEGMKKDDSFIFFNFRTDRTRQLMQAICEKKFAGWKRKNPEIYCVGMTKYYSNMNAEIAFGDVTIKNKLGEVVSNKGLKQLRISETEKYAHVTFFFNGQVEKPNRGEARILIPSPKVRTYDLKPEMSVRKIAQTLVKEIGKNRYNLIVTNLVNGDMVGHTGINSAIKKALEEVDKALEKIVKEALKENYSVLIFGDHGNAEDQTKAWGTSHTTNPVPCILVSNKPHKLKKGELQDISPTTLDLMGLKKPKEMTGKSLIK